MKDICTECRQGLRGNNTAADLLDLACGHSPVIESVIAKYGNHTIAEYLAELAPEKVQAYQAHDDFAEAVFQNAADLIGKKTAAKAAEQLAREPIVLTANHHGIDYFSQSAQGTLLFALENRMRNPGAATATILSCGAVPLDNLTYPLGMLLYGLNGADVDQLPMKLPIFPNRLRRSMVSAAQPLETDMIDRAGKRIEVMAEQKKIDEHTAQQIKTVLQDDYASPAAMKQSSYSKQAVVLNGKIWRRLFAPADDMPGLLYLELEEIVRRLLLKDLRTESSLAWQVFFDDQLRRNVIEQLDGAKACWEMDKLERRQRDHCRAGSTTGYINGCGTLFFWGVTPEGKRVPLNVEREIDKGLFLSGIDDIGRGYRCDFSPDGVARDLQERRIIPSLFTCFMVLAFARGVTCAGGYYQAGYLPVMQSGVARALRVTNGYRSLADSVLTVRADAYLSGMQTVMTRAETDALIPAGPIEIMAGGGLTNADIDKILAMSVRDAHMASLFETLPDIVPRMSKERQWRKGLAGEYGRVLNGKVVIK